MAEAEAIGFACACGRLRGEVADAVPAAFTHVRCHCGDCRSAYVHLGRPDPSAVPILQSSQGRIRFTAGEDLLRVFRHSPKGALRWYAACCDSPLFHTPPKARLVHAGLNADRLDRPRDAGAVTAESFLPAPGGRQRHKGALRMVSRMVSRIVAGNLDGTWRRSPFFDAEGAPVAEPKVSTRAERAAALRGLRG